MKNHKMVNGKLLQMNKTFSDLKEKQKNFIRELLFENYKKLSSTGLRKKELDAEVLHQTYQEIEAREIWLPFGELKKEYQCRKYKIKKKILSRP